MNSLKHNPIYSAAERRAIEKIIRSNTVDLVRDYEINFDVAYMYAVVQLLGFGEKRAKKLYDAYWAYREQVQTDFEGFDGDGIMESAMEFRLKNLGIDVRKWYNEKNVHRLEAKCTK